jgi:hypothetical protein
MLYALLGILVVNVLAVFIIARLGRRLSTTEECLIALEPELLIEGDRPRLGERP